MTPDSDRLVAKGSRSRYHPRKLTVLEAESGLVRNVPLKVDFSDLVEPKEFSLPLRTSERLRTLAQQAISALEHRADEDIKNWAERLATDIADVAD